MMMMMILMTQMIAANEINCRVNPEIILAKQNNKVVEQESCQFGLFKSCKRTKNKQTTMKNIFTRLSIFVCRKIYCFCFDCADLFLL